MGTDIVGIPWGTGMEVKLAEFRRYGIYRSRENPQSLFGKLGRDRNRLYDV